MTGDHIDQDTLLTIALDEQRESAFPHLIACSDCRATIERVRAVRATIRFDERVGGPSVAALSRVKSLMPSPKPASRAYLPWETARRVVATLAFDSRASSAAFGLRGAEAAHLLTFAADDVSLDVELEPPQERAGASWSIVGQLSRNDEPFPAEVVAVGDEGQISIVQSDEQGVFMFNLSPGQYDLLVQRDAEVVIVSEIDVG